MADGQFHDIVEMEWDTFEASLQTASRGTTRGAAVERTLVEYFGDDEYHDLQRLAEQARLMRSRMPLRGNIVLLPGIMGSNLSTAAVMKTPSGSMCSGWCSAASLGCG